MSRIFNGISKLFVKKKIQKDESEIIEKFSKEDFAEKWKAEEVYQEEEEDDSFENKTIDIDLTLKK